MAGEKGLKCSSRPGVPRACRHSAPRWFWSAAVRSEPGPPPPARSCPKASARPPKYATSMRGATLSSYRRSPRATSASPGAWSVNEAFNQGVPVIASDAVGAVAGGLVRHERTGLVVPAGDAGALAAALRRMHDDPALRARLGAAGREAVAGLHARRLGGRSVKRACGRGSRAVASVEAHGSSADAQRADPAARCSARRAQASARRSCASARTAASAATTRRSSCATRASTSPPTSTSTPTAATCSRAPRWPAAAQRRRRQHRRRRRAPAAPRRRAAAAPARAPADRRATRARATALDDARASRATPSRSAARAVIPGAAGLGADAARHGLPTAAARRPHPARPLRARRRVRRPSADVSSLAGSA